MSSPAQRTLRRLTLIVGIQWTGATMGLPLLPLFLRDRGGSPTIVGLIMAGFPLAGLLTQFTMGHLTDRFGRRPILIAGLFAFAVGSFSFLAPVHATWFVFARMVQGAGAGAIEVASLSAVAVLVPETERGRASSRIFAANLFGAAIGPLIGVAFPARHLGLAYALTGLASTVSGLVALRSNFEGVTNSSDRTPLERLRLDRRILGAVAGTTAVGLTIGVYESCWSMLMHVHHANELQIRLSWTIFCVPWVILSPVGGWLADHGNRKMVATIGVGTSAFFLGLYPHLGRPVTMMSFGSLEAVISSLSVPSLNSLLTQGGTDREFGRRQGLSATANTAALAVTSGISGALFAIRPDLPFWIVAITAGLTTTSLPWWWRGFPGRVRVAEDTNGRHPRVPAIDQSVSD
jgi:MFS transporter, DHA1 family, multidrug resistance protein